MVVMLEESFLKESIQLKRDKFIYQDILIYKPNFVILLKIKRNEHE